MRIGFLRNGQQKRNAFVPSKTWLIAMKLRKIISFDLSHNWTRTIGHTMRKNSFFFRMCVCVRVRFSRINYGTYRDVADAEWLPMPLFPKRTFTHLSLEWIGCFFLVLVRPPATNDSLRGNRTIERWMEMPLHNAGTEWEKCNYFNSVIRRVKCGDIVKLYMFFSPAACRCYSSFWVATFEYICLRLFFLVI